jgi:myo-inositol-1(or 4)-monophosphatase
MSPAELRALAEDVAREAGAQLRDAFDRGGLAATAKSSPTDMVSEADEAAEALIRSRLLAARPADGILGEEEGDTPGTSGVRWVVDPLDGTTNFLFGVPQWAVSVACEDGDGRLAGTVYDPMRDELWSAHRDGDATCNGVPVSASQKDDLGQALVATGFGYDARVRARQGELVARLLPRVRDVRRLGAAALDLAWVAAGRMDAYFERGLKVWDRAAGELLCERAGLALVDLPAAGIMPEGVLVAPSGLVEPLRELVGEA